MGCCYKSSSIKTGKEITMMIYERKKSMCNVKKINTYIISQLFKTDMKLMTSIWFTYIP